MYFVSIGGAVYWPFSEDRITTVVWYSQTSANVHAYANMDMKSYVCHLTTNTANELIWNQLKAIVQNKISLRLLPNSDKCYFKSEFTVIWFVKQGGILLPTFLITAEMLLVKHPCHLTPVTLSKCDHKRLRFSASSLI